MADRLAGSEPPHAERLPRTAGGSPAAVIRAGAGNPASEEADYARAGDTRWHQGTGQRQQEDLHAREQDPRASAVGRTAGAGDGSGRGAGKADATSRREEAGAT